MLPEAVGASVFPEQVVVPVREMLRAGHGCRFIMGSVTAVDTAQRTLRCHSLAGELSIPYDHLVLAFGNRAKLDMLPGMAEHALPLKTVGDAMHIRNSVLRRLARIELESDPALRRWLGHFIVIGGGFSGVEVIGELVDCLASIRRYYLKYPKVQADELRITVLHCTDRLLPELSPRLGAAALESLTRRGLEVRLCTRTEALSPHGVTLKTGEQIEGQTLICTIGTEINPLAQMLDLPLQQSRILTNADLSVQGTPNMWALGDCAAVPNAHDGELSPPTAQFAVRQARHLADNLIAMSQGRQTQPFSHRSRGMMASIRHLKGVAEVGGVALTGWPGLCGGPTICRRCPRGGGTCACSWNGPGAGSTRRTSRTCVSRAAMSSGAGSCRRLWRMKSGGHARPTPGPRRINTPAPEVGVHPPHPGRRNG
ncbi:MAG: FAD-dependent oxidoreductase [Aquabacterium sp.]|jgi:NADH:ubiquinone reductase (H+-translocating)|uniref:NAD(P)/FAD-dependent oxidoreductase n=1 Tax=Aquabacterium sp. TaxID=1872578 RepID=UPI003BB1768B